jgi:cellulose synthase/poly-beta-1,6-N-acetylglucosamine synthase-like glycosyltransferase
VLVLDGHPRSAALDAERDRYGDALRIDETGAAVGKTEAQNRGAALARGDVLVFTDAACRLGPGALRALAAPLADRAAAATCGELTYTGPAGPESLYWRLERWLKRLESRFSGLLGANGALYAVRREEYVALPPEAISDLVEPLAVSFIHGGRVVYVPEARAAEPPPPSVRAAVRARHRITLRALSSLPLLMPCLDVFARPRLALAFLGHKALRWVAWIFALSLAAGLVLDGTAARAAVAAALLSSAAGWLRPGWWPTDLSAYAAAAVVAQAVATFDWVRGVRIAAWRPTHAPDQPCSTGPPDRDR